MKQRVGFYLTWFLIQLFRFIPFAVLYVLSDGLAVFLYRILKYREKVVLGNLKIAFPNKDEVALRQIARQAYRNLTDVTLESIKSCTMSIPDLRRRMRIENPELLAETLDAGKIAIVAGSHYNNWEYACVILNQQMPGPTFTAYKPMSNSYTDAYYNARRSRDGMIMTEMNQVYALMRKHRDTPHIWFLAADQSPSSRKSAQWAQFFGRTTAFLPGVDVLARRFDAPVFYFYIQRTRRGYYTMRFKTMCAHPAQTEPGAITQLFAKTAENQILGDPGNWLWSHKRWKINQDDVALPAQQKE